MTDTRRNNYPRFQPPDEDSSEPPSMFGNFFEGWPGLFSNNDQDKQAQLNYQQQQRQHHHHQQQQQQEYEADRSSAAESSDTATTSTSSTTMDDDDSIIPKRKNSVQLGRQVMSEILENDNVSNAILLLQQALDQLQMTNTEGEDEKHVSHIYSQIITSLCNPNVACIVDEMSKNKDGKVPDIQESVMWRLFTKVVESGFVLQRHAHLAVVNTLVDRNYKSLALQAMYALPRREWDTTCYRTAILLHVLQTPKQSREAQGLLSDYGKPYLEIAAPNELAPPNRIEMPLMNEVTEQDQFKLWMFYQTVLSGSDEEWHATKLAYEKVRQENMANQGQQQQQQQQQQQDGVMKEWSATMIETKKQQVDRIGIDNDNTMIFVAIKNSQFEYGWQVYQAMGDAVNEATPCVVMHLCWVAFRQIPAANISRRRGWENRAWTVYSRFMCSEYLHPDSNEAPGFLHDILSIAANSPETVMDKKARYTKTMSICNSLVRLHFDKLLCDDRVLEPIMCTLLYEYKGSPSNMAIMCNKAFEIWNRKVNIYDNRGNTSYTILWGLLVCCHSTLGNLDKVLVQLLEKDINDVPSSLVAIIQTLHDQYLCDHHCYFFDYMFHCIEFTDSGNETKPIWMDKFGFLYNKNDDTEKEDDEEMKHQCMDKQQQIWRTNINELQANSVAMAVKTGVAQQEELVGKKMYYSTKKAKALIRHCLKRASKEEARTREEEEEAYFSF